MENIDVGLEMADPELHSHLMNCIHKYEIRGSEETVLKDWFGKALVAESLLWLMRDQKVDVTGLIFNIKNEIEPLFKQNEKTQ